MAQVKCYRWDDADYKWNETPFTWKEGCIVIELIKAIGGPNNNIVKAYKRLSKDKKKTLITLITKIAKVDKDYADYRSELTKQKGVGIKVTVRDVEVLAKVVLGIKIEITNVNNEKDEKS